MTVLDLHVDSTCPAIDHDALRLAAADLLRALGADPESEDLRDTPRRMAAAYGELLTPQPFEATTFPNDDGYDELIVVSDIPFHSLCMHHLQPFHGVAHVGYLPGDRLVGLSKLARVVDLFARNLQVQERMTTQIAEWLQHELEPKGVALHGIVRSDARTRQEFLALARGS